MKKIICCVVFFGFFINGLAQSSSISNMDGNEYIKRCQNYADDVDDADASHCMGYTTGAVEMMKSLVSYYDDFDKSINHAFCVPAEVPAEQLVRLALKWMEENPTYLHHPAISLLPIPFKTDFPCLPE